MPNKSYERHESRSFVIRLSDCKNFERQEIFERALYPLVNVGFKALEKSTDMVALDEDNNRDDEYYKDDEDFDIDCFPNPDEVDLMFVKKFGFPALFSHF